MDKKKHSELAISMISLLVSGVALYLSWTSDSKKLENIVMNATPTSSCPLEFNVESAGPSLSAMVGFCWRVIFSNASEDKTSIVSDEVQYTIKDGTFESFSGYNKLEDVDGKSVELPIILDGGEARLLIVRSLVPVPNSIAEILNKELKQPINKLKFSDADDILVAHHLDFFGNQIASFNANGVQTSIAKLSQTNTPKSLLSIKTGRGARFQQFLVDRDTW